MRHLNIELNKGAVLNKEMIEASRKKVEATMRHFSVYPDVYLDLITPTELGMKLYFFQRIYLRACMRYSYFFVVAGRGTSKTFLSVLALILRCIFQPGTKQFICAPGKGQGIDIAREKIHEILQKYPMLNKEIFKKNMSSDDVHLWFRNGSEFTVVAALDSQRGGRRNGGLIDEARDHDGVMLSQVVIPLMTADRRMKNGQINPHEIQHAQIFSTSACSKSLYAYEKLLEVFIDSIVEPKDNFVLGLDVRIPIRHKLVSAKLIQKERMSGTVKEGDFAREYLSIFTGGSTDSWFNYSRLTKYRTIVNAEKKFTKVVSNNGVFYIIGVDVGRLADSTVFTILKVIPGKDHWVKKVVNIFAYEKMHFEEQALKLKQCIEMFDPREVIIDGTGAGVGLLDYLIKPTITADGQYYAEIGSFNDKDLMAKQVRGCRQLLNVLKLNEQLNSEIHTSVFSEVMTGKVRFLVKEQEAKGKLLGTAKGQKMTSAERIAFMMPYEMTTRLHDETCNLKVRQLTKYLSLEKINARMRKDKFSSFEYAIWRAKQIEDAETRGKKKSGIGKRPFYSKGGA